MSEHAIECPNVVGSSSVEELRQSQSVSLKRAPPYHGIAK